MNRQSDLTFRHNLKNGRHGWLRLTPAYSIKVVEQRLDQVPNVTHVLDPFSGSGTTGLVCAERGIQSTLIELNPFLVWLAEVKTANYRSDDLTTALSIATEISRRLESTQNGHYWTPPISNIDRWWSRESLQLLGGIHGELDALDPSPAKNLLLVAFCRLVIETSNAAFNHQSMSFRDTSTQQLSFEEMRPHRFLELAEEIARSAEYPLATPVEIICADSRQMTTPTTRYDCVITSPPYPNRMSYIRELRPYMYWLGFLNEAREAGELDWEAIGGTWGIATSRLQ
ncbi:MAG: site-specific DNA-methyltransferase, partial [Anaerolineae bacterium]